LDFLFICLFTKSDNEYAGDQMHIFEVEARLKFLAQGANYLIDFYHNECTYALRVSYGYRWTTALTGNKITEVQIVWNHTKFSVRHFHSYLYTNLSIKRKKSKNL